MGARRSVWVLAVAVALVSAAGCRGGSSEAAPAGAKRHEVVVGVLAIRAGVGAGVGQSGQRATEWWAERVNDGGGVLGRPVRLVFEEESTPSETVERFRKLVLRDRAEVVVGVVSTAVALAVAPVAETMGVPLLMWDGTTQNGVTETVSRPRFVFRSIDNEVEAIAAAILTARWFPLVRTVAGINNDYSYGRDAWETYTASLRRLLPGVRFVEGIFTKPGETDFSAHVAALQRARPDLVMSSFWSADAPIFLKQAAAVGLFSGGLKGVFTTAGGVGDALKKEFTPPGILLGYNTMYFADPHGGRLLADFVADYRRRHGGYPGYEADHAYFVEGQGEIIVGREKKRVAAREAVYVPVNAPHEIINTGSTNMIVVLVQTPLPCEHVYVRPEEIGDVVQVS